MKYKCQNSFKMQPNSQNMIKVSSKNTRKRYELSSKLIIKTMFITPLAGNSFMFNLNVSS